MIHDNQPLFIAPSILSANFWQLERDIRCVVDAGAHWIHCDIMDHHFVPQLTFGPAICRTIHQNSAIPLDIHLMVDPVEPLIEECIEAGAYAISIHPETTHHPDRSLARIQAAGCLAGLALNPASPLSWLPYLLDRIDFVLVMTVNPGFAGQTFIAAMVDKVRHVRTILDAYYTQKNRYIFIEVDGGIHEPVLKPLVQAGAQVFVVGSHIFGDPQPGRAVEIFQKNLRLLMKKDPC